MPETVPLRKFEILESHLTIRGPISTILYRSTDVFTIFVCIFFSSIYSQLLQ